jgi:cation diffusion facilitator CzcD-associated flavoprotein CzcO
MDSFEWAGGKIIHSTDFKTAEISRDKRVVVVGYGKSAHDIAKVASDTAKSTHLVFRDAKWKLPHYIKGINAKYLLLNRLGEAIIKPVEMQNRIDRFVHKIGMAKKMLSFMENYITKVQKLEQFGLVPELSIKDGAFGEISLETVGFFDKVERGEIVPKRGEIASFDGKKIRLSTGEEIECDLLVFAVGFKQTIPFLPEKYMDKLLDKNGNYILYHHILPPGIPNLAFVGYNSSLQTSFTSEFAALWTCEYLKGRVPRPTEEQIIKEGTDFLKWRSQFRFNSASRGLSTMPGTIHHIDILLKDMNASLPFYSMIPDWLVLTHPGRYKKVRKKVIARNRAEASV